VTPAPVLITGVTRRVGLHLALTFRARGVPVVGTWRSERDTLSRLSEAGVELHRCDLLQEAQVERMLDELQQRHQHLRAIIHNASEWLPDEGQPPGEVFRRMLQIHAGAPYRINLALASRLQGDEDGAADVIHMGDYVSARGSRKHIAYAASKAAQDSLTHSFAALLAPRVKVNSIAPALVLFNPEDSPEYRERTLTKSLIPREAGLDEVMGAVDFLMNSRYVTGRVLHLDGGRHLK